MASRDCLYNVFATDLDECELDPCLNDGSCIDGVNSFECACAEGFEGNLCQNGKTSTMCKYIARTVSATYSNIAMYL